VGLREDDTLRTTVGNLVELLLDWVLGILGSILPDLLVKNTFKSFNEL